MTEIATNRYRHDALLCVHQVGLAPLRPSSILAAPAPGVRSSRLLSPVQLPPRFARFYRRVSVTFLLPRLSLRRRISFAAIRRGWGRRFPLRLLPVTATAFRFLLRQGLAIVQPVALRARAKADCSAAFRSRAMETDSRRAVVAAVSFAVRFSAETDPFAVVLFGLCRCPLCLATAGFAPAADPFDPVVSDSAAVVVAAVVADLSDLSAAGLSVVAAADPDSVGSAVFAACLACSVCPFAVALGKGMAVVAVPFCFLTRRFSF